ncbi:MAG: hypothetical protein JXA87_11625 [Thermoleophilia bacterium]|nr:hypothetical protein [Thermoleophilia bacterium]
MRKSFTRASFSKAALLATLMLTAAMISSCSSPPPDIAEADIVGFWIRVPGSPSNVSDGDSIPEPTQSLRRLVAAYNAADGAGWQVDTTPSLFVSVDLANGTRLSLQFSSQFPKDGALVLAWDGKTGEMTEYHVDSPDLLPAVWELLAEDERKELKDSQEKPWLPEDEVAASDSETSMSSSPTAEATSASSTTTTLAPGFITFDTCIDRFETLVQRENLPGALPYSVMAAEELAWLVDFAPQVTITQAQGYRFANGDVVLLFFCDLPVENPSPAPQQALSAAAKSRYAANDQDIWAFIADKFGYVIVSGEYRSQLGTFAQWAISGHQHLFDER